MKPQELSDSRWELASNFIAQKIGLHFPRERKDDLGRGLAEATIEFGFDDLSTFVDWLVSEPLTTPQLQMLAEHLTIGETYFFRDKKTFAALAGC